jgi:hypothetical protein
MLRCQDTQFLSELDPETCTAPRNMGTMYRQTGQCIGKSARRLGSAESSDLGCTPAVDANLLKVRGTCRSLVPRASVIKCNLRQKCWARFCWL